MRRIPWRRSRVEIIRRSFWPSIKPLAFEPSCRRQSHSEGNRGHLLLPFPSNLSKHAISLMATVGTPRLQHQLFFTKKSFVTQFSRATALPFLSPKRRNRALTIPLKPFLQLEKFPKRRVVLQTGQFFGLRRSIVRAASTNHGPSSLRRGCGYG